MSRAEAVCHSVTSWRPEEPPGDTELSCGASSEEVLKEMTQEEDLSDTLWWWLLGPGFSAWKPEGESGPGHGCWE